MPKYTVEVERTSIYEVEADSASEAADIVFDGDESRYKEIGGETKEHWVYDEEGEDVTAEDYDEEEDEE